MPTTMNNTKVLTLDIETTGLSVTKDSIIHIGFSVDGGPTCPESGNKALFVELLADKDVIKRGHNIKFDVLFLKKYGYTVNGPLDDTRILAYLNDPFQGLSLEELAQKYLKVPHMNFDAMYVKGKKAILAACAANTKLVPVGDKYVKEDDLIAKNSEDITMCNSLRSQLYDTPWYRETEQPLIKVLLEMEHRGIKLDLNHLRRLGVEYSFRLEEIKNDYAPVNLASSKQVEEYLRTMGMPLSKYGKKGTSGRYETGKSVLKHLFWDGYDVKRVLEFREISKLNSTYVNPLIEDVSTEGRIHGAFNQAGKHDSYDMGGSGTRTGRLSSSSPNLQNIPARTTEGLKIRKAFIPTEGMNMFETDLSQIEPRMVAHYSQAPKLLRAYNGKLDTHSIFAADIFNKPVDQVTKLERFIGKTCWLATVYGCSPKKLKFIVERDCPLEAPIQYDEGFYKEVQKNFWAANPEIATWRNWHIESTRNLGYVETIGGRKIKIQGLNSRAFAERMSAERQAVNYRVQGSASDIMKKILVRMDYELCNKKDFFLLATVHDSVLGETTENEAWIKEHVNDIMCNTVKLKNVPIDCDTKVGGNWGECK